MKRYIIPSCCCILVILLFACQEDWLDTKQDKKLVIPTTANELQALLDNTSVMNSNGPFMGEASADNYYIQYEDWLAVTTIPRNAYVWAQDIYEQEDGFDWEYAYERIFYANTVLDGLKKIASSEETAAIGGRALFYRAWNFYQLAQLFCKPYQEATADIDPGLPIRLEADIALQYSRASVHQTYLQIIGDLEAALTLVPSAPIVKTRPGKAAVHALLARTYLQMGNYDKALEHAEATLEKEVDLLDYNALDPAAAYPIPRFNDEVIYQSRIAALAPLASSTLKIDGELYLSYADDDLRRNIFFGGENGMKGFKGSYYGGLHHFDGIATDELYLLRAECYAREGSITQAMSDLNMLLEKRYVTGTYVPMSATNADDALQKVLTERRKELVFRGIRWGDLRRLNQDPRFSKTLTRHLNDEEYILEPESSRYVLPLPTKAIEIGGLKQNERK